MQEERLVNLAVLSVEREISRALNLEEVINKFLQMIRTTELHSHTFSYKQLYTIIVIMYNYNQ